MSAPARDGEAGFTLVEVLVALAIFAIIGAAGFAVLDQVLRVQRLTEGRLERLGEVQRAMHVISLDVLEATGGSVRPAEGALAFGRTGGAAGLAVRYGVEDGVLVRRLSDGLGGVARQELIAGVEGLAWRFWRADTGWTPDWPPADPLAPRGNPAALELSLTLAGPGLAGVLRRVAPLPAEAAP